MRLVPPYTQAQKPFFFKLQGLESYPQIKGICFSVRSSICDAVVNIILELISVKLYFREVFLAKNKGVNYNNKPAVPTTRSRMSL